MKTKQVEYMASEIIRNTRAEKGSGNPFAAFSGMDIIDFDDFHQFPPVMASQALYCNRDTDNAPQSDILVDKTPLIP